MTPAEVDATPLWKLAAILGADIDRWEEADVIAARLEAEHVAGAHRDEEQRGCPPCDEARRERRRQVPSGRDLIAERLAHARGEGPRPEADPLPAGALRLVQEGMIDARAPGGSRPRARPGDREPQ